jgi:hypothetical protein
VAKAALGFSTHQTQPPCVDVGPWPTPPKPLAVDLCSGLGGWAEGLEAEGYDVIRVDIEDMFAATGTPKPPGCLLMLQDIQTIHGSQFKGVDLIVASPPCQEYSYMAMPWSLAKAKAAAIRADATGAELVRLTALFNACFRIQREACEAAGRYIPMLVENVRGAQPWVGRARWNCGSMYFWGDVPALMPPHRHVKVQSFRFDGSGRSFQSAAVREHNLPEGVRPTSLAWGNESRWFNDGPRSPGSISSSSSSSPARKAASARIAKVPFEVSNWIGKCFKPTSSLAA